MPTQLSLPGFPPDQEVTTDPQLEELSEALRAEGVEPDHLTLLFIGPNDSIIGECRDASVRERNSFTGIEFISLVNPKRVSRMTIQNRQTGEILNELRFGELDFVNEGTIELRPSGGYFLDWCDVATRKTCYSAYLGFFEGRRMARMRASGLVTPAGGQSPERIESLLGKIKA